MSTWVPMVSLGIAIGESFVLVMLGKTAHHMGEPQPCEGSISVVYSIAHTLQLSISVLLVAAVILIYVLPVIILRC